MNISARSEENYFSNSKIVKVTFCEYCRNMLKMTKELTQGKAVEMGYVLTCCRCKATYSSWNYLRKHMEDRTSEKYLECDKCEMKYELKEKIGDHK